MLNRRQFLQGVALATLGSLTPTRLSWAGTAPLVLSAVDDEQGRHCIAAATTDGEMTFISPVPERCHGGCARPRSGEVVLFARRPGWRFHVVDAVSGTLVRTVAAGEGRHFYGHGAFSPDGRYLYVTANRYESGDGVIRVYDAERDYAVAEEFSLAGIGPHEVRLHPDGDTLVVALGGIRTHPDYERVKLNLDSMAPALLLVDRHSGKVRRRVFPSHHQLSCRHLDVGRDGVVIAGYQSQGPVWETPPLIARLDTRDGTFSELVLPDAAQAGLENYTASVAIAGNGQRVAITAPRGNRVLLLDTHDGRLLQTLDIADAAGVVPEGRDGFLVSSGPGGLYRVATDHQVVRIAEVPVRWDNHLTLSARLET